MRIKIAEIRLAPGQVGFYDELTNIHLTLSRPFATVYQGMNTSRLQQSVNSGRLILVQGSLKPEPISLAAEEAVPAPVVAKAKAVQAPAKEVKAEPVQEAEAIATLSLEEEVVAEAVVEEAVEEAVEEVATEEVVEAKSKKKTSKK